MQRQQPVISGPPSPSTMWHDFCSSFLSKCYNFLKVRNSSGGKMNHASHRDDWLQSGTRSVRSGVSSSAAVTSEECWCSSEMCSMPYGEEHLRDNLSVVRDFVNSFATWSPDFRQRGSGMQGWLQQKWLRGFLSFQPECLVHYWSCVRPHPSSFNTTCNPYGHAAFKHVPSLAVVCQKVFLAITAHCKSLLHPLSLSMPLSCVAPVEGLTMALPGYTQWGILVSYWPDIFDEITSQC